ncbi:hypothetical protein GH714_030924 [Hevea brasiliensis]|uniref:Transcription repressor n=1 Tax=Hevea brasiliensis TaxID=3981 RepID=A0A6A6M221_HEVBR|nr:hypothetical protein GH714_030924 [Hevea brasiliensis]
MSFQQKIEKFEIEEQVPIHDVDMAEEDHNAEKFDVKMLNFDEEHEEIHASLATEEENSEVACSQEVDDKAHILNLTLESVIFDVPEKQSIMISGVDKVDEIWFELVNSEKQQGDFVSIPEEYHVMRNVLFMTMTEFQELSKTPDWTFLRENKDKITFLFGDDDHWGPLQMLEEISKQVPDIALSIEREGHTHNFSCTEAGSASLISNRIIRKIKGQYDLLICKHNRSENTIRGPSFIRHEEFRANWLIPSHDLYYSSSTSSKTNPSTPGYDTTISFSSTADTPPQPSCDIRSSKKCSRTVRGLGRIGGESLAVEKDSDDPYLDFRQSMLQMILEKEIYSKDDLRELLNCFLQLNSPYHHGIIVRAFTDIWDGVYSARSSAAGGVGGGGSSQSQQMLHYNY